MRRPKFANENLYHVYNRGVEKRKIFLDKNDYFRMIHNLFEFNDTEPAENIYYKSYELRSHNFKEESRERKSLVKIHAFCLMPNHFHLLLEQIEDNGISEFMKKIGIGYAMYFNLKNERSGTLFQGRFKAVHISDHPHLIHLPYYIHLNPLDLIEPSWRNKEIQNHRKTTEFLNSYRWSSYLDYAGRKNFPSITERNLLEEIIGKGKEHEKKIFDWLKERGPSSWDKNILLE